MSKISLRHIVVVSDLHVGSFLGLCPPKVPLDDGGHYEHSSWQKMVWNCWEEFWGKWVPSITHDEPFGVVVNGDLVDGQPHGSVAGLASAEDQVKACVGILQPIRDVAESMWVVRGTEAHVGKSGQNDEAVAKELKTRPCRSRGHTHSHYDLELKFGDVAERVHFLHHVGTTSSAAYETSALTRELAGAYTEAQRWGRKPPDLMIRSHRHRTCGMHWSVSDPKRPSISRARVEVTPAWQLKTPFAWKVAGASHAQIGGLCLSARKGQQCDIHTRVWPVPQTEALRV